MTKIWPTHSMAAGNRSRPFVCTFTKICIAQDFHQLIQKLNVNTENR